MIIEINPYNIDSRLIDQVVDSLKKGAVIIFPTDTVYAMGCDLYNKKGLQELAKLKEIKLNKSNFSIICKDFSEISNYVKHISRPTFKLLKQHLPGPFTFILPATTEVSKLFDTNRKEIGIRIPDNPIILKIVEALGNPVVVTSLKNEEDTIQDYFADPYAIYERYDELVDYVVDGGYGNLEASTIVDCTTDEPQIIRQGKGMLGE